MHPEKKHMGGVFERLALDRGEKMTLIIYLH